MAPLLVAALAVAAGYRMIVRQGRRGNGSAPFLLPALPIALLLLIAPVPFVAMQTIATFKAIGASGGAYPQVSELAIGIVRPLWFSGLGFLVALCAAGVIQILGMDDPEQVDETPAETRTAKPAWPAWVFGASPLLLIPAALLIHLTAGIASLLVMARAATSAAAPEHLVNGMDPTRLAQMLSARLIVGVLGGFALLFAVIVFGVAGILAHRYSTKSDALTRTSRVVVVLVGLFCLWNLASLTILIRAVAR